MQLDDLNVLAAFLAVAEERSFTRAAKRVGVSRSALSHFANAYPDVVLDVTTTNEMRLDLVARALRCGYSPR